MLSHMYVLAIVNLLRSLGGIALAGLFIYYSDGIHLPKFRHDRLVEGDLIAFVIVGWAILTIAILRGWQGGCTLFDLWRARRSGRRQRASSSRLQLSRKVGFGLSVFDLINLALFPISTACGLYGILVYRHPDTVDFYEGRFEDISTKKQ